MSARPPKIVIPGLNRGAGVPGGYLFGRLPGSKQGPAQLLGLPQLRAMGLATTATLTASTSLVQSVATSQTTSLSTGVSSSLSATSGSVSGAVSSIGSLSTAVSTVISSSISAVNSRVDSLSTAGGGGGGAGTSTSLSQISSSLSGTISTNVTQSTSLSQISSSLSGAISSTSSLSTAVSTVDANQSTSLSANASSITSLSTAVSTVDSGQSTSLSQISGSLSGAISSTTSLSSAVSTVDSNQSTSLSQISTSLSTDLSLINSLSTAVSSSANVEHPGYIVGNWYWTVKGVALAGGATFVANTIKLLPFTISKPITVGSLAAHVTTNSGGGNFQLAIYANNAATGRPTGAALCSTASISTAATGAIGTTVTGVLLNPGTYWMAINQDNGVAVYKTLVQGSPHMGYYIGTATLATASSGAGTSSLGLSVNQTFGTWPNLTSASFTESTSLSNAALLMNAA